MQKGFCKMASGDIEIKVCNPEKILLKWDTHVTYELQIQVGGEGERWSLAQMIYRR